MVVYIYWEGAAHYKIASISHNKKGPFFQIKLLTRAGAIGVGIWNVFWKCKSLDGFVVVQDPLVHFAISS